ncbi:hypothetical protein ABD76_24755 [Paenibacillus dendritiformis]|uniref:hypothetical protein n=1 Tax=Paenibacillus dendritiformis TaxID=130049 RepID=UPI0018CD2F44|nr:hypothetical protein [Paenibacillus dendritiformis]MBG9795492.1 hypothetical protein [Paenibacillus dendritiformis]
MGTGNFFSVLLLDWQRAELHGVELDSITGRISRQLYLQATIHLGTKNFTYLLQQGQIYYCENGYLLHQDIKGKKAERIKGLCEIKSALLDVIQIQSHESGYDETELKQAQQRLNQVYDHFVQQHGFINDRANSAAFADDDQLPLLRSIEDQTPEKTWMKAAIFSRPTIKMNRLPDHADNALEALQICLNQRLRVDLPYIAHLCGKSVAEVREELGDRIFLNPQKIYRRRRGRMGAGRGIFVRQHQR